MESGRAWHAVGGKRARDAVGGGREGAGHTFVT